MKLFRKKSEKRLFKIDYLKCAHEDDKMVFFKKEFEQFEIIEAVDKAEAIKKFYTANEDLFATLTVNVFIKRFIEVQPMK